MKFRQYDTEPLPTNYVNEINRLLDRHRKADSECGDETETLTLTERNTPIMTRSRDSRHSSRNNRETMVILIIQKVIALTLMIFWHIDYDRVGTTLYANCLYLSKSSLITL